MGAFFSSQRKVQPGTGFNRPLAKLSELDIPVTVPRAAVTPRQTNRLREPVAVEIFKEAMTGVAVLTKRADRIQNNQGPLTKRRNHRREETDVTPLDSDATDEYVEGIAIGVDRRILKRLRAGEFAVQAHLDLHGLSREQAEGRVQGFLRECWRRSQRCVLIVHGRGLHSADDAPVLKQAVRVWLERGAVARLVLAFVTARPCDGGPGAVYVLLRSVAAARAKGLRRISGEI